MKVRLSDLCKLDVAEQSDWYDQQRPQLGDEFAVKVLEFASTLSHSPRMYGRVPNPPKGREVRQGMLSGFPFVVVYEILANEIVIVDVSHAKMKRRPWRNRL